jgi:mono/diheme cytochrome c family protein
VKRRERRWGRLCLAALLSLGAGGCEVYYYDIPSPDDLWYIIPWFDHMIGARYIRPYETDSVPRYTIEGTVPVTGGEPDWLAEWSTGNATTANALRNPFAPGMEEQEASPPGPEVALISRDLDAAGDTLYGYYCAVCHGTAGDAKGPVSGRVGAPSLLTSRARAYTDGYLYSIVRYGRGVMPRYGDKIYLPSDRWAIVNHVRKLQAQTPAAPEPAAAAAPIAPAPSATGSGGGRPR